MSDLTDYARDLLSRALCGRAPALPKAVYVALGTGGGPQGLSGEPVGRGYARQRASFTGNGPQRSAETLRFAFTTAVGPLTHVGLFDAAFGGNSLTASPLTQAVALTGPGVVTIAATDLLVAAD